MKHGKRLNARTVVLNYTDKPPAGKPLTALRWTPGAVDTCELDAPATQAHTGHTTPPRRAGGGGRQPPNHTAQVASAPRPASGPDTSGTAQPPNSRLAHHLEEAGLDALEDLVFGHLGGGLAAQIGHLRNAGEQGVGGGAVGVAHVIIKHHPVTDVNNIPSQIWEAP